MGSPCLKCFHFKDVGWMLGKKVDICDDCEETKKLKRAEIRLGGMDTRNDTFDYHRAFVGYNQSSKSWICEIL
jgi:hypothetical protein